MDLDVDETIQELEEEMLAAANNLEFEKAALLRDQIRELKRMTGAPAPASPGQDPAGRFKYPKPRKRPPRGEMRA